MIYDSPDGGRAQTKFDEADGLIQQARRLIGDGELIVAQTESLEKARSRLVTLQLTQQVNRLSGEIISCLAKPETDTKDLARVIQLLVLRFLITGERRLGDLGAGIKQISDVLTRPAGRKSEGEDDGDVIDIHA